MSKPTKPSESYWFKCPECACVQWITHEQADGRELIRCMNVQCSFEKAVLVEPLTHATKPFTTASTQRLTVCAPR